MDVCINGRGTSNNSVSGSFYIKLIFVYAATLGGNCQLTIFSEGVFINKIR
jgi:hypothetical protein